MHAQSRPLARPADRHAPVHAPDLKSKWPKIVERHNQVNHSTLLVWHSGPCICFFGWKEFKYADHALSRPNQIGACRT